MNTRTNSRHVVVVGGGYAGTMAANRLAATGSAAVTLISPNTDFVERIRLHQLAAGTGGATVGYDTLLHPDIERVVAAVERIDGSARTVLTSTGGVIGYDRLIYAVGSGAGSAPVPGVTEFAHTVSDIDDANRLAAALADTPAGASVVVVGGGLTGVEMAAEVAQAREDLAVTLICGAGVVPSAGVRGGASVTKRLRRLGVDLIEHTPVGEVADSKVVLTDGRVVAADITVWTAGFAVPDLASRSGLGTDAIGRLRVDATLVSIDDPHVIGAGDAITVAGRDLRMSCQAAMPLGAQAANTVRALLDGDAPAQVDQGFAAQCISLGRTAGTVVATHRDDRPRPILVGGRAGAVVKEQVCRMTLRWIAGEGRRGGSYSWTRGPRR
ncbi:FAD-dependent oxidoreductase [Williamsia sp.]|uniref:NAD(P)/FAD-dependent oxidoreductase n=1 Tax=Williamsia sp. TaxID=1872085 RepID=UPI001A1F1260|nr:FAD-dependent oxidoreductase [Williamsia sp.]MBJ7291250.1 FAD-dependent oxidoreductase [Williamsia sp.]